MAEIGRWKRVRAGTRVRGGRGFICKRGGVGGGPLAVQSVFASYSTIRC